MKLSIVIPSKTAKNLRQCVQSLQQRETDVDIVVVDDFPEGQRPTDLENVRWCPGIKPFVFARNVNLGIKSCEGDVVILNDDAQLRTHQGLTKMQRALEREQHYGVLAGFRLPRSNHRLYEQMQRIEDYSIQPVPLMVPFFCALIPKRTRETLAQKDNLQGLLDERFIGYGYDDDDYCLRVRAAGMQIGVFRGCAVDHTSLQSTYRATTMRPPGLALNRRLFCDKWGNHPFTSVEVGHA